jgi:MFS family permease
VDIKSCKVINNFTATYYDKLFCERKIDRTNIQAMFAFGGLVGMFGLPALADVMGRRLAINASLVVQFASSGLLIGGIYMDVLMMMMVGHFLAGVYAGGLLIITFVYTGEVCNDRMRQIAIMIYCSSWYDIGNLGVWLR